MKSSSQNLLFKNIDPQFFADYMIFSGTFRHYVAKSLESAFRRSPNELHRRFYVFGLYEETYAGYEDMGAMLEAFMRWKKTEILYPVEGMLRYNDGKVILVNLFERRGITSPSELYKALDLASWISPEWEQIYPTIQLENVLKILCQFIYEDCQNNQKRYGIDAYNRLKHGLAIAPSGQPYNPGGPDFPAIFIRNEDPKRQYDLTLFGLPMDDAALAERHKSIEFNHYALRILAALYLIYRYPDFLKTKWQLKTPENIFDNHALKAAKGFMQQISDKLTANF